MSEELKTTFVMAEDGVDPNIVPKKKLNNGEAMPAIGMGTFGSDRFTNVQIANAVVGAAEFGQRAFDCASVYGNEKEIGVALKVIQDGGVPREELYITSKVWNDMHGEGEVIKSCKQSLEDLQLDYLDLYLVHWPFPNFHAKGCSVDSRSPDAKPYIHENFMKTWAQMEQLVEMGLVKTIGTSNMTQAKMELLLRDCKIKPAVTEMELHPHFQQQALFDYYVSKEIQPIGFCPIGSPTRPDRDKTETDTVDIEDPVVKKIAERLGVHPAVVCIKWAVQRGQIPIPFSVFEPEYRSNLKCALPDYMAISSEEMTELAAIDKNCRLIKGQVFLWKDGQTWEDLWDEDDIIAD
ncbi:Aldo/keto reductase [Pontiella desulfatans]|uniref:Aldo/keto reductase n=2 Tax=Pontiella desulfatans TaxID=2750659 RepID=A0A6C2U378_PONDE|nr:aldo/keto reductase [Pontiella desulfatans]VGO14343.1 Aldo/keto reductase [Pontiella desulfatans]